jgi:hypothetical protein
VAFTEHRREKINTTTLQQFENKIDSYLVFIKDNLHMISSYSATQTDHRGVITYIPCQLKLTNIPLFCSFIRNYHVEFQEGKHATTSTQGLLNTVEKKIRVLKHAEEWDSNEDTITSAMALSTTFCYNADLIEYIPSQVTKHLLQIIYNLHSSTQQKFNDGKSTPYPDWMFMTLLTAPKSNTGMENSGNGVPNVPKDADSVPMLMTPTHTLTSFASNVESNINKVHLRVPQNNHRQKMTKRTLIPKSRLPITRIMPI